MLRPVIRRLEQLYTHKVVTISPTQIIAYIEDVESNSYFLRACTTLSLSELFT